MNPDELLDVAGVAALLGIAPGTISAYKSRGRMPVPIGRLGGSPIWTRRQIEEWRASRPGLGWRRGVSTSAPASATAAGPAR